MARWGALGAAWAAVFTPIVALFAIAMPLATGLPEGDDYDETLAFADGWLKLHGFAERLRYVVRYQHNEYKLLFQQILYLLDLRLRGHLDFVFFQRLGEFFLLLMVALLWLCFQPATATRTRLGLATRLLLFAPICSLLFAMRYEDILDSAVGGLQQLPIFPFVILGVLLLERAGLVRFSGACAALALAVATSGNGFFLAIVGALFLLQQRRLRAAGAWCGLTLLLAAVYFYGYIRPPTEQANVKHLALQFLLFPFAFLGGVGERVFPALAIGLVLAVLIGWLVRQGWRRRDPVTFYLVLFLLITAAGVTATRFRLGLGAALSPRYALCSQLLLALLYMAVLRLGAYRLAPRKLRVPAFCAFLLLTGVFCLQSDWQANRDLDLRFGLIRSHYAAWQQGRAVSLVPDEDPALKTPRWIAWRAHAAQIMRESEALGVFQPPALQRQQSTPQVR